MLFPGMRILVMLLLDTLPMLGNVLLLCFFVFFIFGIVGVQLWEGILRQRCELVLPSNVLRPKYVSIHSLIPLLLIIIIEGLIKQALFAAIFS